MDGTPTNSSDGFLIGKLGAGLAGVPPSRPVGGGGAGLFFL